MTEGILIRPVQKMWTIVIPVLMLIFIFSVPTGSAGLFDGLPWSNPLESITLSTILPLLFVLGGFRFLQIKAVKVVLGILSVIKLLICLTGPQYGWSVKVFPTLSDMEKGAWIETYSTSWSPGNSDILNYAWREKKHFSLEWAMARLVNSPTWKSRFSEMPSLVDYRDAKPWIEFSGYVRVLPGTHFTILTKGVKSGELLAINSSGERKVLNKFQSRRELEKRSVTELLGEGVWSIQGTVRFAGDEWSVIPLWRESGGEVKDALPGVSLYRDKTDASLSGTVLWFFYRLHQLISAILIALLAVWGIWLFHDLRLGGVLIPPLMIASCTCILLPYLIYSVLESISTANTLVASAGLAVFLVGVLYLFWSRNSQSVLSHLATQPQRTVMILACPSLLLFFTIIWWPELNAVKWWSTGDDWATFQSFAYQIVAWGEFLRAGESVFFYQPGYRYVIALLHWLFGKSSFVQQMVDVWFILGGLVLVSSLSKKMGISGFGVVTLGLSVLAVTLVGPLRHHIGRGLSEFAAMFFIVWCAFLTYQMSARNWVRISVAGLVGTLAYWLRQDHLPAIAAIGFLSSEASTGTVRTVWARLIDSVRVNWKAYLIYWGILVLGVAVVVIRNGLSGEHFGLTAPDHPNLVFEWQIGNYLEKLWLILFMAKWRELPNASSALMLIGVLMGLLACGYRPALLQRYPLAVSLILIALLAPYYFVGAWGYPPRFSIHVLPFGAISFFLIFDKYIQELFYGFCLSPGRSNLLDKRNN